MRTTSQLLPPMDAGTDLTTSTPRGIILAVPAQNCAGLEAVEPAAHRRSTGSAMRTVAIMAFCQSLLFLLLWLAICVRAGAATPPQTTFQPYLIVSAYNPVTQRDPLGKSGLSQESKVAPGVAVAFRLEGILYSPSSPSAIVNGTLVTLNKTVTLTDGNGQTQVKPVEITRERVVLETGGQRVELRLNPRDPQEQTRP